MGHFLDLAYRVLSDVGHPLRVKEITQIGLDKGLLKTRGQTPSQTMKSKLSTDILTKKQRSLFMRTGPGEFGLREWNCYEEYISKRFKKGPLDEKALVFPASSLSTYIPGPGLHTASRDDVWVLLGECRSMLRRLAEKDHSVIQLVSVFIVKFGLHYLTYKRTKRLPENRLHGYYSLMFGGHLSPDDRDDILPFFDISQPEYGRSALLRELEEEVEFYQDPNITYKGLLYDESRELSRQHLGIVYHVILKSKEYEIKEPGSLMDTKFETIPEIEARLGDFENWSVMIVNHEKKALKQ